MPICQPPAPVGIPWEHASCAAGRVTADLYLFLLSVKSTPPVPSPTLQQTACCVLASLSVPISSGSHSSFPQTFIPLLIALYQSPALVGTVFPQNPHATPAKEVTYLKLFSLPPNPHPWSHIHLCISLSIVASSHSLPLFLGDKADLIFPYPVGPHNTFQSPFPFLSVKSQYLERHLTGTTNGLTYQHPRISYQAAHSYHTLLNITKAIEPKKQVPRQ